MEKWRSIARIWLRVWTVQEALDGGDNGDDQDNQVGNMTQQNDLFLQVARALSGEQQAAVEPVLAPHIVSLQAEVTAAETVVQCALRSSALLRRIARRRNQLERARSHVERLSKLLSAGHVGKRISELQQEAEAALSAAEGMTVWGLAN